MSDPWVVARCHGSLTQYDWLTSLWVVPSHLLGLKYKKLKYKKNYFFYF